MTSSLGLGHCDCPSIPSPSPSSLSQSLQSVSQSTRSFSLHSVPVSLSLTRVCPSLSSLRSSLGPSRLSPAARCQISRREVTLRRGVWLLLPGRGRCPCRAVAAAPGDQDPGRGSGSGWRLRDYFNLRRRREKGQTVPTRRPPCHFLDTPTAGCVQRHRLRSEQHCSDAFIVGQKVFKHDEITSLTA